MSEYKEAEEWVSQQFRGKTIYDGHPLQAIHRALRIADKLMQEPSEDVIAICENHYYREYIDSSPMQWLNDVRDQLLAEVEEEELGEKALKLGENGEELGENTSNVNPSSTESS